jgi:hypothetical protein
MMFSRTLWRLPHVSNVRQSLFRRASVVVLAANCNDQIDRAGCAAGNGGRATAEFAFRSSKATFPKVSYIFRVRGPS